MVILRACLLLLAGCFVSNLSAQHVGRLDIYLCIGQSNMAGRGCLAPEYLDTLTNVYLFNEDDIFEEAVNPLNRHSTIRKELSMQRVGISYSFAKRIAQESSREVGLVVNARGGSAIDSWLKGSEDGYMEEALIRIKKAMKYGELKGIIWHQGEANCKYPDSYLIKFKKFVSDLRAELGCNDIPFIFGELSQWNWTNRVDGTEPFNKMLRRAAEEIDNSYCVSSKGLAPMKDETDPHFSSLSQIIFGNRYADVILRRVH